MEIHKLNDALARVDLSLTLLRYRERHRRGDKANPRISRSASAAPRSPATVEKRANMGVCFPTFEKIAALAHFVMSCVVVKVPYAPQPLACIRRSGMTSRSKCASFSISQMSWSRAGPRRPAVAMFVLSGTGAPVALVKRSGFDIMNPHFPKFLLQS